MAQKVRREAGVRRIPVGVRAAEAVERDHRRHRMSRVGARHVACVIALEEVLHNGVGHDAVVSTQNPVQMHDDTMPQPDLTILRRRSYRRSLPTIADISS